MLSEISNHRLPGMYRGSNQRYSIKIRVPNNFPKFTGKHLCQSLFFKKETLAQVFSCEFCEISKNIFFTEHLGTTTSACNNFFNNDYFHYCTVVGLQVQKLILNSIICTLINLRIVNIWANDFQNQSRTRCYFNFPSCYIFWNPFHHSQITNPFQYSRVISV